MEKGSARPLDGEERWEYGRSEMVCRLGMMKKEDVKSSGNVFASYWGRGVEGGDVGEKRWWKRQMITVVEEEGEEDGGMDGIVGLINNPLIECGFEWCSANLFGLCDTNDYRHTLKKLCAFLG